jgi:hypothetical protein
MLTIIISGFIVFISSVGAFSTACLADDSRQPSEQLSVQQVELENSAIKQFIEEKLKNMVNSLQDSASISDRAGSQNEGGKQEATLPQPSVTPVYLPPIRGAPVGRVAGGTRGILDEYPSLLCVISPDHTAMTIRDQPQLHWYLREKTIHSIEFTVIEEQAINPLLETPIRQPLSTGIQRIRVADFGIALEQGVIYKWFISIVPDPNRRSKDILAWGAIQYVSIADELAQAISQLDDKATIDLYARTGLWYDAFASVSDLIQSNPEDKSLLQMRNVLLEQVGLSPIIP